jgi:hypothetical protein
MSKKLDIDKLSTALDNNTNENIINMSTRKIMELNLKILKELMLDRDTIIEYLRKLKGYRYIDELSDLKYGSFIRWMPIIDPTNLTLNQCGIICDIKITDNGVIIVCKNFLHRHYTFKMDEVLIFQKLTPQENVIISAIDYLETEPKQKGSDSKNKEDNDDNDDNDDNEEDEEEEDDEEDDQNNYNNNSVIRKK